MSLIGSLEQFDLANILRRIEVYTKTGLLVVKQGSNWAEFYFRQGQLVCIGPVRANVSLIDRLLQARLLSTQSLPQIMTLINPSERNETQIALTLINEGYLSRDVLRAWASHEASQMLTTLLSWSNGEIYFEDDCPSPADRLLVGISISTLLEALPTSAPRPAAFSAPTTNEPVYMPSTQIMPTASALDVSGQLDATQRIERVPSFAAPAPGTLNASDLLGDVSSLGASASSGPEESAGLFSASQLIEDFSFGSPEAAPFASEAASPSFASANPTQSLLGTEMNVTASNQISILPPQPVQNPLPPARIDTSFMTPDLVLVPVDLSSLRERNPQVQLTVDQWRLFALIDGQSPMQVLAQALTVAVEQVCMVAGELMAIGLVTPQPTGTLEPAAPNGMANSVPMPAMGQYSGPQPVWSPQVSGPMPYAPSAPQQPQWGNGNPGAVYMMSNWMLSGKQPVAQGVQGQPGAVYAPARYR